MMALDMMLPRVKQSGTATAASNNGRASHSQDQEKGDLRKKYTSVQIVTPQPNNNSSKVLL